MKKFLFSFAVVLVAGAIASAAPVFSDDFNSENGGQGQLNYVGFANWSVQDGSVDLIGEGTGWNFFPGQGYGLYVDLDGSTNNAGKMLSTAAINLQPGTYVLSYELAGNQRYNTADAVNVQVNLGSILSTQHTLSKMDPFTLFTHTFSVSDATSITLSFEGLYGDNVGMLLDNVQVNAVPAPGAVLLAGMGTGLVGWLRRRNHL